MNIPISLEDSREQIIDFGVLNPTEDLLKLSDIITSKLAIFKSVLDLLNIEFNWKVSQVNINKFSLEASIKHPLNGIIDFASKEFISLNWESVYYSLVDYIDQTCGINIVKSSVRLESNILSDIEKGKFTNVEDDKPYRAFEEIKKELYKRYPDHPQSKANENKERV